ncbi:hypothetical protein GCK72_014924 [Caenorhabditis remanei]|uniref:Uncharacterized protein n=1 Tax=Caenorhabditis remanei TaxID=31234 RepID=E3M5B3_CAERE|nr:hypothetical protein GCK72_014924 [Caenorhabditis remanei]EFO84294.1 hypothetical protein CRE_02727 [Caenorhabditis remanei]EFO92378.1 hypothetical protein CRE_11061 [Caenorhabditis remanei]KAF1758466.1 hypothetical protein GCK72_014924 [Caenorhabditis remanei]
MRSLLAVLVVILALINATNAQWGFGGMPMGGMGMGGMGMMGGGPYGGMGGGPYGGMGGGYGGGGGWGRRRMMGGMMNPYMGMMYGR